MLFDNKVMVVQQFMLDTEVVLISIVLCVEVWDGLTHAQSTLVGKAVVWSIVAVLIVIMLLSFGQMIMNIINWIKAK